MKVVVQVKLMPDAGQALAFERTLHTVNEAANWVSAVAFEQGVPREYELRKHTYAELKSRGLGVQAAQHVIKKVRDAYTTLEANIRAGNLGKPGSHRRVKAGVEPIVFRAGAAQPYDDRCLSWQYDAGTVSVWTVAGRVKNVPFACSPDALNTLREYRQGESDLVRRDGVFYLIATCEVPEAKRYEPEQFIGVDLGITAIAITSTGYKAAGRGLNRHRKRQLELRRKLQKKGTKSAKRLLKKRSRSEKRHATDQNHIIAKTIVTEAERKPSGPACPWSSSIRPTPHKSAPSAATSITRTGQANPFSSAGTAGSLPTRTGTLPATSPATARLCGLRGVSHASLPPIVVPGRRSPPSSQLDATSKPGPSGPGQVDYR